MKAQSKEGDTWLSKYANNRFQWQESHGTAGLKGFKRRLGLVETTFDVDGLYYGGRADINTLFDLAVRHTLSEADLRRRIVLAWTSLRLQHVMLMSSVDEDEDIGQRCFYVDIPMSKEDAVEKVEESLVWVGDENQAINGEELFYHAFNVGRIIEPAKCLSKLHILPVKQLPEGTLELRFYIVLAHQISDGLSAYSWFSHFIHILNQPLDTITADINALCTADRIREKLPKAQEDLYPPVAGNIARQRWFWAMIHVLRHVRTTMPATFTNPLRRDRRLEEPLALEPKFDRIFNYSAERRPPMSSTSIRAALSRPASQRLVQLSRSANVSIGAGCFALAGLAMMDLYEARFPEEEDNKRPAFAASFPLNPRAFFTNPPAPDSCMLAFSEGILMPFLPSSLPVEGRFKLTAKHANRELRMYQKRLKQKDVRSRAAVALDKHSPARLLATGYLGQIERVNSKLSAEKRWNVHPQGSLAPSVGQYGATCGVSSVGSLTPFFKRGMYDLEAAPRKDIVADFRELRIGVRARDDEFLIGSCMTAEGIVLFDASYDLNAISQEAALKWKEKIEGMLETGKDSKL